MSYQVLARKWRPKSFQQLVGQDHVVQALVNGLEQNRLHHAFLFTGTRGVGKTTIARILAKCLNCEQGVSATPCGECGACVDIDEGRFVDMLEIDAASRTKVDDTRELLDNVQYTPSRGRYKVYIIDEVHMLSTASFNALLKTLEEPPPHVKFVLATTDPQKIPVTILSRCLQFNLRRLTPDQIAGYLDSLLQTEAIDYQESALLDISRAADGSMRDALSLLDQAIAFGGGKVHADEVGNMLGSIATDQVFRILQGLADGDAKASLAPVDDLASLAADFDQLLLQLSELLHRIALIQQLPDYRDEARSDWDQLSALASRMSPEDVQLYYQIAVHGRKDLSLAPDPQSGVEMTVLRMLAFRPESSASGTDEGGKQLKQTAAKSQAAAPSKAAQASASVDSRQRQVAESILPNPSASTNVEMPADTTASSIQGADSWQAILPKLDLRGAARELARNLQLSRREESVWHFEIAQQLAHMGSAKCCRQLGLALSHWRGQPLEVRLHSVSSQLSSPAALDEMENQQRLSDAEKSIAEDPTVQALQKQFGAKIINDTIEPIQ